MAKTRREFLKASAMATVCVTAGSGCRSGDQADPADVASDLAWHKSVCRFCSVGCGVEVAVRDKQIVAVRGDAEHPTTRGMTCAKPLFLPQIVHSRYRLKRPMIRVDGKLIETTWDEAMTRVADSMAAEIREHGPDRVAYYGSGQGYSEEAYLANRLFKGGIGTNNVAANFHLANAAGAEGNMAAYGVDGTPGSGEDFDAARVFFVVGNNTAESHPVLFDRILRTRREHPATRLIVLDPRATPTARSADLHLAVRPGTDMAVLQAMARAVFDQKLFDERQVTDTLAFVASEGGERKEVGFEDYAAHLTTCSPAWAEEISGVPADTIVEAAAAFAAGPTVSLFATGLHQYRSGVAANHAVHNLHLLAGQIDKPGAAPFALPGQGNAQGVRDCGALSDRLPYGRRVDSRSDRDEIETLWGCPPGTISATPGLDAPAMIRAAGDGKLGALWIAGANPAQMLPNLNRYRAALSREWSGRPLVVVTDAFFTWTARMADVVLPVAMWSEREGVYTNFERRCQLAPKLARAPKETRGDFDILLDLAARLEQRGVVPEGFVSGRFRKPADVWAEMQEASRGTAYDRSGMDRARLRADRGVVWPLPAVTTAETPRRTVWLSEWTPPGEPADAEYPYLLTTGRVLEHWESGSMTEQATTLRRAQPTAFVEIHPDDAGELGLLDRDLVRITSRRGEVVVKAIVTSVVPRGLVFVPIHWGEPRSLVQKLTRDDRDPASGQMAMKTCAVRLAKAPLPEGVAQ